MRRRTLALLAALVVLAGCGSSARTNDQPPEHRLRPGSNQNAEMNPP